MQSEILKLYYNENTSYEKVKLDREYWLASEKASKLREELCKGLSEEKINLTEQIYDLFMDMMCYADEAHYKVGFKTGLLLGIETVEEEEVK